MLISPLYIASLILIVLILLLFSFLSKKTIEIKDNATDLSEVLPIQNIEQGYIINGNGDITAGFKVFLPEVFTLSSSETEKISNDYNGILKMLPAGTVIHQQNFYYEDSHHFPNLGDETNFIYRENLKYYEGKPILHNYTYLYITFSAGNPSPRSYTNTSLLRKLNYPFQQPYKDMSKRLPEIRNTLINFENGLKGLSRHSVIRMTDTELNNAVFDYINCSYATPVDDATTKAVAPITISHQGDLKIGNRFVSVLSLVEEGPVLFPYGKPPKTMPITSFDNGISLPQGIKSKCSMIYPVGLGLPFDHIVNVIIEVTDTDSTTQQLKSEATALNTLAVFYPPARYKQKLINNFCEDVLSKGYNTAYTSVSVLLTDTDRDQLQRKISLAQNAFMGMNESKCYIENYETANLFFTAIPGNARSNYRGFISTVTHSLSYICKEGMYLSDPEGYIFLDRFGTPCVIDLWNTSLITNRNALMIGPSGTGKSYWICNFVLQSIILGFDIIIVDIGGSYKSMILLNRGKYFDSKDPKSFSFNPFLCKKNKQGKYIYMNNDPDDPESTEDKIKLIATVIVAIWKGDDKIDKLEWALLKQSVIDFYDYVNAHDIVPDLTQYDHFIMEVMIQDEFEKSRFNTKELSRLLKPYTTGEYSFLLNAKENIDITGDSLIGFDLEAASRAEYFPIITILVLNLTLEKIRQRRGIKKRLIIDEGLDFLMDSKMGEFIGSIFRTFRKKEGGIMLATQKISFINNIDPLVRESTIGNCDIKIILDHREYRESYPDIKNILSFTDDEIEMLDSIQTDKNWRQFLIKVGSRTFILGNSVSPVADAAFNSQEKIVVEIERLFKSCGSLPGALNQFLENERKKLSQKEENHG